MMSAMSADCRVISMNLIQTAYYPVPVDKTGYDGTRLYLCHPALDTFHIPTGLRFVPKT